MKNRLILLVGLFAIIAFTCKAQEIGKIYPKAEAKVKFGAVIDSVIFPVADMKKLLEGTKNYAMFKIANGKAIILGDGRKVLYPNVAKVDSSQAFCYCSKSKLLELMNTVSANTNTVSLEMHKFYFTITYGDSTLEDVLICPPFCD